MPLVRDVNNDVHIEYSIPENILELITDDFLKEFRNQLFRIHEYWSLETFAEYGIPTNTSTGGWYAAFGKACLLTRSEKLFDYWRTLQWYDSDIFDGELAELLVKRHFILGDLSKVIEEQLGIKEADLVECCDCGKLYTKDMVVTLSEEEAADEIGMYRCLCCDDIKHTNDGNGNATIYYQSVLKELDDYRDNHPIKNEEV